MASKTHARRSRKPSPRPARRNAGAARVHKTSLKKSRKPARKPASGASARAHTTELALATFAHEVRTPLTGILALSSLLETSGLAERERRWVESIKASAEHLSALATLFVDAARSGGPGLVIRHDFFDLRTLTQTVAHALAGRAAAKGLGVSITVDESLPGFALGDPVRLRAALENLIDNAVKFTDSGEVALDVKAADRRARKATSPVITVAFTVTDSGIGLTLAEIKRLFRPFSQASVAVTRRFGGAGLGLASVRQLARAMGGDVVVQPRRGGGAAFTLTVALDRADARTPVGGQATPGPATPGSLRALKILSVEDNPFGRVVLNTILQELGHQVTFVGRGEELEQVAGGPFDLVLMDMVLPGIDGVEAIRRIRASAHPLSRVPIIGVSGRGEDEGPARRAGADGFLLKPVSPRELAVALAAVERPGAEAG